MRTRAESGLASILERLGPPPASRHSLLEAGNLLVIQERERRLRSVLRADGIDTLEGVRGFDAGCAGGYNLRWLVQWGGRPEDQAGIDIDAEAVELCRARTPGCRVYCGSAETIPEPTASFDLVLAFTLFSSVRDESAARAIGTELLRITRAGGLLLIYDMRRRSPANPAVRPVTRADIARWFPGSAVRSYSMTLVPPLARVVAHRAPALYWLLAAVPLLRTHYLHVVHPVARARPGPGPAAQCASANRPLP